MPQFLNLLSLSRNPDLCLKLSDSNVKVKTREVHVLNETEKNCLVEWFMKTADIFTDHLLRESFSPGYKFSNCWWRIINKVFLEKILQSPLWIGVEHVETHSVLTSSECLPILNRIIVCDCLSS